MTPSGSVDHDPSHAVPPPPAREQRADIQALRGVAVLLVLLFHLGGRLPSGFIGVDMFFVISGYVISMIYLDRLRIAPTLANIYAFVRRRTLRLMPALLVSVTLTMALAYLLLPPTENKLVALSAGLSSIFYTSNIFFLTSGANYWLETQSHNPFLHTWSLGVEWQFYLLFAATFIAYAALVNFAKPRIAEYFLGTVFSLGLLLSALLYFAPEIYSRTLFYSPTLALGSSCLASPRCLRRGSCATGAFSLVRGPLLLCCCSG
jgi:peptidoglycan/LPS O-acetylase OafA/YrhL